MTQPQSYNPSPAKRKPSGAAVFGIVVAALFVMCCSGVVIAIATHGSDDSSQTLLTPEPTFSSRAGSAPAKAAPAARATLTAKDLALKVKLKSKQCFGSAGCNVEYTIDAALVGNPRIDGDCDVTYEVKGFSDGTQVHTLTITSPDDYEQDGYQAGSTSSSSKKLTAKVTDVVCR